MANATTSPLATYIEHLERGELAYQFSLEANAAIFYPRVICPFTGSDKLEWRISKGTGTVYATTVVYPQKGEPVQCRVDQCGRRFPHDEPGGGHCTARRAYRLAREVPRAPAADDEPPYPVFTPAEGTP